MARRKAANGNGHGVAGKSARGRPKKDPAAEIAQINRPSEGDLTKFLRVYNTRKNESIESNTGVSEHMAYAIKTLKWPRWATRALLALLKMDVPRAQAEIDWLIDAFEKTEHGKQRDWVREQASATRTERQAEIDTTPATV